MSLIENERTKLFATALNTSATSCVTVGLFTPLAALLYNLGGAREAIGFGTVVIGFGLWLSAAAILHLAARRVLGGLKE
jgi:hypothetical protein